MKKLFIGIFAIIYLAASIGVSVDLHFCMGSYAGHEYFASKVDECGKCGMKEVGENGCCHDEFKVIKVEDDQKTPSEFGKIPLDAVYITPQQISQEILLFLPTRTKSKVVINPPPDISGPPIFVKNCIFRI